MLFPVETFAQRRAVVRAAQFIRERHRIHMLRLPLICAHIFLRRRTGRFRTVKALFHSAQKVKLVKGLVIPDADAADLQLQRYRHKVSVFF